MKSERKNLLSLQFERIPSRDGTCSRYPDAIRIKVSGYLPENLDVGNAFGCSISISRSRNPCCSAKNRFSTPFHLFPYFPLFASPRSPDILNHPRTMIPFSFPSPSFLPLRRPALPTETVDIFRFLSRPLAGERAGILKFSVSARF